MTALHDHLSADELDALHAGVQAPRAASHLVTCAACRTLLAQDSQLLVSLTALGGFDPAAGFVERVITHLDRPALAPAAAVVTPDTERSRAARRRVVVGGLLTGGVLAGGFAWAAINPGAALGLTVPAFNDLGHALWMAVQTVGANAVEQPWFAAVRDTLASPARAVPVLVVAAGAYASVLLGLRRLLTRPATDAAW